MSSSSSSSLPAPTRLKRKRTVEDTVYSGPDTPDSDSGASCSDSQSDKPDKSAEEEDNSPVLSHAAKRKQKKEELKLQIQGDDSSTPKKRKLRDGTAAPNDAAVGKIIKRQNSVWVGNMSFKTTEENLRTFFRERGVVEATRINLPTKAAKGPGMKAENRGFAYVDFETPDAKKTAIALSEQPLLGRKLLIKDGDDFTGRPDQPATETTVTLNGVKKSLSKSAQKILKNQKQPPAPTLFFGNLGFDTTEDSIRGLLEAHREKGKQKGRLKEENVKGGHEKELWIRKVRLGTFEDSGKCKGFAFVDFTTPEFATSALVNPRNHHLNGRDLVVEYASAEAVRRGTPKGPKAKSHGDVIALTDQARQKQKTKDILPHKAGNDEKSDPMQVDTSEKNSFQSVHKLNRPVAREYRGDKGRPKGRPKPGAALAYAKRESAAIVPSQGQKISF